MLLYHSVNFMDVCGFKIDIEERELPDFDKYLTAMFSGGVAQGNAITLNFELFVVDK